MKLEIINTAYLIKHSFLFDTTYLTSELKYYSNRIRIYAR